MKYIASVYKPLLKTNCKINPTVKGMEQYILHGGRDRRVDRKTMNKDYNLPPLGAYTTNTFSKLFQKSLIKEQKFLLIMKYKLTTFPSTFVFF